MPSQLRGMRTRDTSTVRDGGMRSGRGTSKDYFEDLGISTTKEHATRIREDNKILEEQKGLLQQERGKYEEAKSTIKKAGEDLDFDSILAKEWKAYEPSLVTVRAVNPKTNEIMGSYRLPKSFVDTDLKPREGLWATYVDDGKFYNISAKEVHHTQQIAANLQEAERRSKEQWYADVGTMVAPKIAEARGQLTQAEGTLQNNAQPLFSAEAELQDTVQQRELGMQELKKEQENRIKTMRSIFEKFSVK